MEPSNLTASKYEVHHIRPIFTFKDETHTNRNECIKFANQFNENLIRLSIKNHMIAHYFLWKIFDNKDSKCAFQTMYTFGKEINELTIDELNEIAICKEDCSKHNKTDEEISQYKKEWWQSHRESEILKKRKNYNENKDVILAKQKEYYRENKDFLKSRRETQKEKLKAYRIMYDSTHRDVARERANKRYHSKKEELRKQQNDYNLQLCFDPYRKRICTVGALNSRKARNKELYKNIIQSQWILKFKPIIQHEPLILTKSLPMIADMIK